MFNLKKFKSEIIFGIFFASIILIYYFYKLYIDGQNILWLFYISIFLIFLSIVKPSIFKYPNIYWIKLGILLGKVISPIVMFLIYFLIIFPINLILKIFKKDILKLNYDYNIESYWIDRNNKYTDQNNQF